MQENLVVKLETSVDLKKKSIHLMQKGLEQIIIDLDDVLDIQIILDQREENNGDNNVDAIDGAVANLDVNGVEAENNADGGNGVFGGIDQGIEAGNADGAIGGIEAGDANGAIGGIAAGNVGIDDFSGALEFESRVSKMCIYLCLRCAITAVNLDRMC